MRFDVVGFVSDARCGLAGLLREYESVPAGLLKHVLELCKLSSVFRLV